MSTTYVHTRIGVIDSAGNTNILYPQNTGSDVLVNTSDNANLPANLSTVQDLVNSLAATAFASEINDSATSSSKTWSSSKINTELGNIASGISNPIDDSDTTGTSTTKTWSSSMIKSKIAGLIDDTSSAATETWSASKIVTELNSKSSVNHNHNNASSNASGFLNTLSNNTNEFLRGDGVWNTPPNASVSNDGYMSTSHYSKLDNLYTKSEIDTLIENSGSSGNSGNYGPEYTIIYEEIYLGDHVTEEQSRNIANGSFNGLLLGSYWTIDGTNYRIMARDIYYATGELQYHDVVNHHVVVMPDTIYSKQKYNNSDTNSGGYSSSILKSYIENTYNPYITNAFGENHILSHTHDLTSGSYNSGTLTPTANTKAWLINSYNVDGQKYQYETNYSWKPSDKLQFPAFRNNTSLKISKYNGSASYWWLGSSRSNASSHFCLVTSSGTVSYNFASGSRGVRPAFLLY